MIHARITNPTLFSRSSKLFGMLESIVVEAKGIYADRIGLYGHRKAILHIRNQDLGWRPLNHNYALFKRRIRRDKMYILTNSLRSNITYWKKVKSFNSGVDTIFIGVPNSFRPTSANISYGRGKKRGVYIHTFHPNYVKMMELGSTKNNQPARPLWKPVLKEVEKFVASDSSGKNAAIAKSILNHLRRV